MIGVVGCEYSGRVRDAFNARGHDFTSVDLLPTERAGQHHIGDVLEYVRSFPPYHFKLGIFHPPCTFLTVSGNKWFYHPDDWGLPDHLKKRGPHPDYPTRRADQEAAIQFVLDIWALPIERIAIENPTGVLSTRWRKPSQIIQPWQFGHGEIKATHLWLKNLPLLNPTAIVSGREARVHKAKPGPDRWKERSETYTGIAEAFATQWGIE